MQVFGYTRLAIVAVTLTLAGAGLWFGSQWRDANIVRARAEYLFGRQNDSEALRELARESRVVRLAYLRLALEAPEGLHPHELTVALTQVHREEARFLYEEAIRPAIAPETKESTLLLALALIERWDVRVDAVAIGAAAKQVSASLVQPMLTEQDPFVLRALDEKLTALAKLAKFDGRALANRLLDAAQSRNDLAGVDSQLRAARALHDSPAVRSRSAALLAGRAHAGLDAASLAGIALAMGELAEQDVTPVARLLVSRIEETREAHEVAMLASGLVAVGPGVPVDAARDLAIRVGERVLDESDPAVLVRLAIALHGVSHGWSDAQARAFASRVLDAMRRTDGSTKLRIYAAALHAVEDRVSEERLAAARAIVRARLTGEALRYSLVALGENGPPAPPAEARDPLRLLDPTLPEAQWTQLALQVIGEAPEVEDPTLEQLAGVDDDDGVAEEPVADVDFNALSDALATLRRTPTPHSPATRP